jgi:ribose/xylose/arabinose/galactoside ABC-type transport system permease subunit
LRGKAGGNKDAAQRLGFQVFRLKCLVYGYLGQRPACHASSAAFSAPFSASRCLQSFRIPSSPATEFRVPGWQAIALLAGFAVGAIVGLINGFVIAYLGVSPILATLGTNDNVQRAFDRPHTRQRSRGFPDPIVFLVNGTPMGVPVGPRRRSLSPSPRRPRVAPRGPGARSTTGVPVTTRRMLDQSKTTARSAIRGWRRSFSEACPKPWLRYPNVCK